MRKIMIFEEVRKKAFDNSIDNLVLFGERNFLSYEGSSYDLIFHSKQANPYDKEKPCSLVIPVLRAKTIYRDEEDKNNIEKMVREAYEMNPNPEFTTYAVSSEFLDFYEIILDNKDSGPIPVGLGKYKHIAKRELIKYTKKPVFFMRAIQEKKRIIDFRY